jgi:hypothetical protein
MLFFARISALLAGFTLALTSQACFYDHRVVQHIQEQRRAAKEAEGAKIRSSGAATLPARHVGQVRFYVAEDYRKQHPEWRHSLEDLVDSANAVLRSAFGVGLEVSELHEWSPRCTLDDMNACLGELADIEASESEWVVGVRGVFPSFTSTFDELGLAELAGHRFVMRDVSDLAEHQAIEQAFPMHTPNRRAEIYQHRKEHKRLAVFLHEWAHTLGALHTPASDALLHASYDDRMASFDGANSALIAAGLEDRFTGNAHHEALLAALEHTTEGDFDPGAAERLSNHLQNTDREQEVLANEDVVDHPFVVKGPEETLLSDLSPADRAVYRSAVQRLLAEDPVHSVQVLGPLVERYAACYAVQHLACGLSMQLGMRDAQVLCTRAQKLAPSH